jgi:cytoskeletal protein CcmA (bactofilin family)
MRARWVAPVVAGWLSLVALSPVALPPAAARAAARQAARQAAPVVHGDQIVLDGDALVRRGEAVGDVVVIHGTARIRGTARGSVVVFRGPVEVSGTVEGDAVALDGSVTLLAGARVTGDVWVPHGDARVQVGARVDGEVKHGTPWRFLTPRALVTKLAAWIAITVSTLLLGLLLIWLAPRGADAVYAAVRDRPGASIGWGVGAFVGLPALAVLAVVSLVGIPFGLGLLLALAMLYSVGYVWSAWVLGRWIVHPGRHGYQPRRLPAFLAGWAILRALGLVPVAGAITYLLGSALGLGLMAVATWRARRPPPAAAPIPGPAQPEPAGAT